MTLHVVDEGDGPPIVFVHGVMMSGRFFEHSGQRDARRSSSGRPGPARSRAVGEGALRAYGGELCAGPATALRRVLRRATATGRMVDGRDGRVRVSEGVRVGLRRWGDDRRPAAVGLRMGGISIRSPHRRGARRDGRGIAARPASGCRGVRRTHAARSQAGDERLDGGGDHAGAVSSGLDDSRQPDAA